MTQSGNRAEALILELWTRTRIDWGFASERISEIFRREKWLGSQERRDVAETLYGMIRMARRIDFALEALGPQLRGDERERARLLAYQVLAGQVTPAAAAGRIGGDWAQVAAVDTRIARVRDPVERLGLARSLPDWLARRLLDEHGAADADRLADALNHRAPLCVRANTLKIDREALRARLAEEKIEAHPTRFAKDGLVLDTRTNVFGLAAFKEGLLELQDEASQLVAELVAPPPRGLVVDACAGAGGKTLALGALMQSRGRLVALDVDARKLEELRRRARRAGISNARAVLVEPQGGFPDEIEVLRGKVDRVLVDAPCSGLGALRRNPEARWRLQEQDLLRIEKEQLEIARRAMGLVAPGGRLIYATCTILRQENEGQVERLLALSPGWQVMRVAEIWGTDRAVGVCEVTATFLKTLPHVHDTDGFFAAVLRRVG